MGEGSSRAADLQARNLLVIGLLAACSAIAAVGGRVRGPRLLPSCPKRVEVASASFDQLDCEEALPRLLARAGRPIRCGDLGGLAELRDGDRLEIGAGCDPKRGRMSGPALRLLGLPIDVNRASVEDLEALPGIGPVMAARILKSRPFRTLDELREVSGIGPLRLAALRHAAEVSEVGEQDFGRR